MTFLDLLFFTGAAYGAAWFVTRSKLMGSVRQRVSRVWLLGDLIQCVVCMSAWTSLALALAAPHVSLFSPGLRERTAVDVVVLVAWMLAASWALARALGDAD
jgi:hypothetical protein